MAAHDIFLLAFLAVMIGLWVLYRKEVQRVIEEVRNELGGPPGPMGPLPSTDAHLLLKRPRKEKVPL